MTTKKMRIIVMAALGNNGAIGIGDKLPWQGQQRADMKRFVDLTMGFPIIVGRKTYEAFPNRPLPGRTNIVITRNSAYPGDGCVVATSLEQALVAAKKLGAGRVFVIGGTEIYTQALPMADELVLTLIHGDFPAATVFFPEFDFSDWEKTFHEAHGVDARNRNPYTFVTYVRRP